MKTNQFWVLGFLGFSSVLTLSTAAHAAGGKGGTPTRGMASGSYSVSISNSGTFADDQAQFSDLFTAACEKHLSKEDCYTAEMQAESFIDDVESQIFPAALENLARGYNLDEDPLNLLLIDFKFQNPDAFSKYWFYESIQNEVLTELNVRLAHKVASSLKLHLPAKKREDCEGLGDGSGPELYFPKALTTPFKYSKLYSRNGDKVIFFNNASFTRPGLECVSNAAVSRDQVATLNLSLSLKFKVVPKTNNVSIKISGAHLKSSLDVR